MDEITGTAKQRLFKIIAAAEFEGVPFRMLNRPVREGDTYLVARNTGPHLLTVKEVNERGGWVVPEPGGTTPYPFDLHECLGIELLI
jgi:hypothetical protein